MWMLILFVNLFQSKNYSRTGTDINEVNRLVADAASQFKLRLSVIIFLYFSAFV